MNPTLVRANDGVFSDQILGARERQEDAVTHRSFNDGKSLLVVLADGMGGHQGGEVASRTSVDAFVSAFFTDYAQIKTPFRLFGSLERANKDLEVIGKKNSELEGMGSTLVAAVVSEEGVSWISVGDSLLLRVRGGKVHRLNEDHSMAPLLDDAVKKGKLTSEEAAGHRDRNALRSAVSGAPIDLVDVKDVPEPLRRGDVLILASDGLLTLTEKEIAVLVNAQKSAGARAIVNKLLGAVSDKNKRRQDNTTIAAVLIERSSSSEVRSQKNSSWRLAFSVGAAVISLLVGIGLGSGFLSVAPPAGTLSTVADKVRAFEIPKISGEVPGSTVPQPVDIPDSTARNEDVSPKTPATEPAEPDSKKRRNESAGKGVSSGSRSNKSESEKSKPVVEGDLGVPPSLGEGQKAPADVPPTGPVPNPALPQEVSPQKKAEPVETVKKPSGDSVGNGATATPELKAKEPVPGSPGVPQIKPPNAVPGNGSLTPGPGPAFPLQSQPEEKKNDKSQ